MLNFYIVLVFASLSFVTCPTALSSLTYRHHSQWKCGRICYHGYPDYLHVKKACATFHDSTIREAYTPEKIREDSTCISVHMLLKRRPNGPDRLKPGTLGVCSLGSFKKICISGSENSDDLLVWDYIEPRLDAGDLHRVAHCKPRVIFEGRYPKGDEGASTSTNQGDEGASTSTNQGDDGASTSTNQGGQ